MSIALEKWCYGGLSSISNASISLIPSPNNLRTNDERSTRSNYGTTLSTILLYAFSVYMRKHSPSNTLPARPALCIAELFPHGTTIIVSIPFSTLYAFTFTYPQSIIYFISAIVIELYAIFVANIILRYREKSNI